MKVLTAGAFRRALMDLVPSFEKQSGISVSVEKDTAGALVRRIKGGEAFDVVIASSVAVDSLIAEGKIIPASSTALATVGVGVMVRAGAPKPYVGTVEAFKRAVLAAQSIAYIDPASGGSSGIYVADLLRRLGIAAAVREKTRLKHGGHVADLIATGEAEFGIHQISEILPHTEVAMVGPLPAEIQSYTTYAAGISVDSSDPQAAGGLICTLTGANAAAALRRRGMDPAFARGVNEKAPT